MCLNIASQALTNSLGFCDYNRKTDQVSFRATFKRVPLKGPNYADVSVGSVSTLKSPLLLMFRCISVCIVST